MLESPAPDPPAICCGTTQAVAFAIIAAYCPATRGVGTPTHAVAPAEGSWSGASWTGGTAARSSAGSAAYSAAAPGDGTRSQNLPTYGGEAKANSPSAAACSATALRGAVRPPTSTVRTGVPMSATAGTSSFPWLDTKGILRTQVQFPACPSSPKTHVSGCHQ